VASPKELSDTYKSVATPSRFGPRYQPSPEADVFGRRTATPLEVQRVLDGEYSLQNPQALQRKARILSNREKRRTERRIDHRG